MTPTVARNKIRKKKAKQTLLARLFRFTFSVGECRGRSRLEGPICEMSERFRLNGGREIAERKAAADVRRLRNVDELVGG